jgi:hypothetical protein
LAAIDYHHKKKINIKKLDFGILTLKINQADLTDPTENIDNSDFKLDMLDYEDRDLIYRAFLELKDKYTIRNVGKFKFDLKRFKLLSSYSELRMISAFQVDNQKSDFKIALYWVGGEPQIWGIATLKKDFGHVLITKETVIEKIMDWIQPMDLDFQDDPEFSKKVFLVAKDKTKASLALDFKLRNSILEIKRSDFLIEIINNNLIIGNRKLVNAESLAEFIGFLNKL